LRVAVVGGGVVGLLTAVYLAREGHEALIVEESPKDRRSASYSNAGVLHLIQPPPGRMRRRLAPRGARLMARLADRLGIETVRTRLIIAYTRRPALPVLAAARAALKLLQPGVRARIAGARELRGLEPLLSREVRGGLLVEGYRVVDPRLLMDRLWEEALSGGAALVQGRAVRVDCSGLVELQGGETVRADAVLNAAGPGAERLARPLGIEVRTRRILGVMELYPKPRPGSIVARLPLRLRAETKGGAIIPWPGGRTLYGPSFHPDNRAPPLGWVASLYRGLLEEEPSGRPERIMGYRTVASPRDFHVIRPPGCPGTVHLLGIESPGFTAAPLLAWEALRLLGAVRGEPSI